MVAVFTYVKDNWVAIMKLVTATFLSAMVIMKREAITTFVGGAINSMIAGIRSFVTAITWITNGGLIQWIRTTAISLAQSTLQLALQTKARVVNTVATARQTIANNIASLSFSNVGKSVLQVMRSVLLLGAKFLLIAGIVLAIVGAIYANWDVLKQRLAPIFEFIAKV